MVMAVIAVLVWRFSTNFQTAANVINFTQFMGAVNSQQVSTVTLTGNEISGRGRTGPHSAAMPRHSLKAWPTT